MVSHLRQAFPDAAALEQHWRLPIEQQKVAVAPKDTDSPEEALSPHLSDSTIKIVYVAVNILTDDSDPIDPRVSALYDEKTAEDQRPLALYRRDIVPLDQCVQTNAEAEKDPVAYQKKTKRNAIATIALNIGLSILAIYSGKQIPIILGQVARLATPIALAVKPLIAHGLVILTASLGIKHICATQYEAFYFQKFTGDVNILYKVVLGLVAPILSIYRSDKMRLQRYEHTANAVNEAAKKLNAFATYMVDTANGMQIMSALNTAKTLKASEAPIKATESKPKTESSSDNSDDDSRSIISIEESIGHINLLKRTFRTYTPTELNTAVQELSQLAQFVERRRVTVQPSLES